jgi:uncharacterized protein DUF1153
VFFVYIASGFDEGQLAMLHDSANIIMFQPAVPSDDPLNAVPKLPRPSQRWTPRRKEIVVEAVRGGWVPINEICDLYRISVDEFLAWERDLDRYGVPGLRSTRYQIYRDTDKPSEHKALVT